MELDEVKKLVGSFEESLAKPAVPPVVPTPETPIDFVEQAPPAGGAPGDYSPCLDPNIRDLLLEFIGALPVCEGVS